jgi:radical SAM enzyme (rSAM/lipoprotein system)
MSSKISLRKKTALELFRVYKKNLARLHELNYIFWECTLRCNLNCLHCGSDCKTDSVVSDMPLNDFLCALDTLKNQINPNKTMIVLTGGETLLRKDLGDCGQAFYERGFPWGLVTNGYELSEKKLQSLLNTGLRAVTVSLDGFEESHNWLRNNKNSFRKAFEAVKILQKYPILVHDVVTVVNQKNFAELAGFKEKLIEIGLKNWRIFTVFPIGRGTENQLLQLSSAQFRQLFEFIRETRKENRIKLSYGCEGFLGEFEGDVRDGFFFCNAGIKVGSVLADGSISACPNMRNNYVQGNIYKDNFAEVWNTKYQIHRNRLSLRTGECVACNSWRWCEGNGMHLRDEKTGELLFCHLKKIGEI